ncbi:MAG: AmmeMemoRadiSam system radical SAM enzyme [Chloroflexi bacterium RBG_16_48_8]|nr:MAG: AmmeMemoRadiSam system radical SAM enzyme [Chloroflexi bacterium RBG_16_48_8]
METLSEVLDNLTMSGQFYETLPEDAVRCYACGHRCFIRPGRRGICQVRFNRDGELHVPFGYVGALQCDPIEKKPFFHLFPGSEALSFGMLGCDFHCSYCQNWVSSQALRDSASDFAGSYVKRITPEELVNYGRRMKAGVVASTYNEPLITSEWALAVFKEAKEAGMLCAYVSNGNATPEVLKALRPTMKGFKIDLKTMQDKQYRQLGGVLQNILDTIRLAKEMDFWVEVVTLVVPGFNDSNEELMDAARYLVSVSPDIPWHVTAFHKNYKMTDPPNTTIQTLIRAAEIGQEAGLHYVYAGNLPGSVDSYENTFCPKCGKMLIERLGYVILSYHITSDGTCPKCDTKIAGVWPSDPSSVQAGSRLDLFGRRPRTVR